MSSITEANPLKVHVGNLSRTTTEEGLKACFGPAAVEAEISRSKKFGWVTFATPAAAAAALEKNGVELDGWKLVVNPHRASAPRAEPEFQPGNPLRVYVTGLPEDIDSEAVANIFGKFGEITKVSLTKPFRGTIRARIAFGDAASATGSLVLDNATVNGNIVRVRPEARANRRSPKADTDDAAAAPESGAPRARRERAPRREAPAAAAAAPASGAPRARRERAPRAAAPPAAAAPAGAVNPAVVAVLGLKDVPPETIAEHFAGCGDIDSIRFKAQGSVALVQFVDVASATKALSLNGSLLAEQTLRVEPARAPRAPRAPRPTPAVPESAPARRPRREAPAAAASSPSKPRASGPNPATVWLGDLPEEPVTQEALAAAFGKFGAIATIRIGTNFRFAFVTFENASSAAAAASASPVTVSGAAVKVEAQRGRVVDPARVYVGDLPEGTTEEDVKAALASVGTVVDIDLRSGYAHVGFGAAGQAEAAAGGSFTVNGVPVRVEAARPKGGRRPRAPRE